MSDLKRRVSELAGLMEEFGLDEAEWSGPGWRVAFRRKRAVAVPTEATVAVAAEEEAWEEPVAAPSPASLGTPVASPMAGVFYATPSPSAPPFVREGDTVVAGQVVAIIEAMKVMNEITAPVSGKVTSIVARPGQLVEAGQPLLYIA
ncbi:MAG: biotin/lipoyl-containing protein [Fimbriimonadales bacterium]